MLAHGGGTRVWFTQPPNPQEQQKLHAVPAKTQARSRTIAEYGDTTASVPEQLTPPPGSGEHLGLQAARTWHREIRAR